MIEAYIDESGAHHEAPFLVVAAYFAPYSTWRAFNRDWQPILKQQNISCFHAKERRCDVLRPSLAKIIEDRQLWAVVATMARSAYSQCASAQVRSSLGDAYAACASLCVSKTCKLVKSYYYDQSVSFFIEAGQPKTEHLLSAYKLMEGHAPGSDCAPIASVTSVRKEDFAPLQTADFLSHVYSTSDFVWFNYLSRRGRIYVADVNGDVLKDVSKGVKWMLAEQKRKRQLAKKQDISES